jgi:hypothetical protein
MANVDIRVAKRAGDNDQMVLGMSNEQKDILVSQGLPPYTEVTRSGAGWATMSTSAVAGLVVRPGTAAAFEIHNVTSTNGASLIIDRLFAFNLVSTAALESYSLWAQVTTTKSAPTDGSFVVRGSSGQAYGGKVIAAASTTVIASGWFPWTNSVIKPIASGTVTPQGAQTAEVAGRLIVPPGSSLCLHVVSSLVGQTFTQGASWYEKVLTIES